MASSKITRRRFLRRTAGVAGVGVVSLAGLGVLASQAPSIPMLNTACGKDTPMAAPILIAYASICGSTAEVAGFVAQILCAEGLRVEARPAPTVTSLDGYGSVILGTALRFERPLDEAIAFAERHRAALARLPAAAFSLGIYMREDTAANREKTRGFLAPLLAALPPAIELGMFGGKIDYANMSFFWRTLLSLDKDGLLREGDWRNWDAIGVWTRGLIPRLTAQAPHIDGVAPLAGARGSL